MKGLTSTSPPPPRLVSCHGLRYPTDRSSENGTPAVWVRPVALISLRSLIIFQSWVRLWACRRPETPPEAGSRSLCVSQHTPSQCPHPGSPRRGEMDSFFQPVIRCGVRYWITTILVTGHSTPRSKMLVSAPCGELLLTVPRSPY